MSKKIKDLQDIANILRKDVLEMTSAAGSGHPTSCLSCAELVSCLFFNEMKYDIANPDNPDMENSVDIEIPLNSVTLESGISNRHSRTKGDTINGNVYNARVHSNSPSREFETKNNQILCNDEFILSKGHAAPILYSALSRAGVIKDDLFGLRKIDSNLEGHPLPNSFSWAKVATGSLGQGLSVGIGFAIAAKLQGKEFRTYVLMGDSETAEGSVWEGFQLASYYKLKNLCAIIDVNRLGQRGETMLGWNTSEYEKRIQSFGWETKIIDGHNIKKILKALKNARKSEKPFAIIAKTIKGKGVSFLENKEGWHGKALGREELEKALKEIGNPQMPQINIIKPGEIKFEFKKEEVIKNEYNLGEEVATREAYGNAISSLAKSDQRVIAVDAEVSNSTFSDRVKKVNEKQFIEAFIAEQNMVGICLGLSKKGFNVYGSTFAAFLSRAHDQIRMSALSLGDFTLCGSHCGVSIGEDGASQMGLEDIGMFRSLPNSIIFYPSDAVSTEKIVNLCSESKGIKYIRTTRGKTKVIYKNEEKFSLGGFKVLKESGKDKAVLAGSGITLHEALKAYDVLKKNKIECAVIDLYCIKPFNAEKFIEFLKKHGNKMVIAEDHYKEGGIGEMLCSALVNSGIKIECLNIKKIPHSGKPEELLAKYDIDKKAIVKAAMKMLKYEEKKYKR